MESAPRPGCSNSFMHSRAASAWSAMVPDTSSTHTGARPGSARWLGRGGTGSAHRGSDNTGGGGGMKSPSSGSKLAKLAAAWTGLADIARHVIFHVLDPRFLSYVASHHVASNSYQAHCPPRHRHAL